MKKKTLLLCFLHGFKGDENTFATFPAHLRALVSHALPNLNIAVEIYPTFETRGDLNECVSRFRDWLQDKVIDLEVAAQTPSPTVDPSVRTILVGHSMGGIVAAEMILALSSEKPLHSSTSSLSSSSPTPFMFPYIAGLLAFDTPYLGISPGVVAHGAEGHYNTASTAITQLSGLTGALWGGSKAAESMDKNDTIATVGRRKPEYRVPLPEAPNGAPAIERDGKGESAADIKTEVDAAAAPAWQRWGKIAMFAGAAGAVAAGGAAAYMKRESITSGWGWVGSHLEFVGCLMKGEELKQRLQGIAELESQREFGFANLYTLLSEDRKVGVAGYVSKERTFCSLPKGVGKGEGLGKQWFPALNSKASDETWAHMSMFMPKENPEFYGLSERAKDLITGWVEHWNEASLQEGLEESPEMIS